MVDNFEADLSNKVSYHFLITFIFMRNMSIRDEAESRQKLRNRQVEFQAVTFKSCFL